MKAPLANRHALIQQAGFTLLEMLVVVVVLGLLIIGLTQGVRAGLALWDAQSRRSDQTAELDAAARVLRSLLSGITASPTAGFNPGVPGATGITGFKGTPESLVFIGDLPTGLGTTRRAEITLTVNQERLVLRWIPHRHELSAAPPPEPTETELVRKVDRLELAYWGSPSPDRPAGWQTQWEGSTIPELIRLRLVLGKDDRRHFPDLIAATQS